jgi:DNA repair protein RecO (recombination protein O)
MARGARRSKKRFGGALSAFALLRVEVREGRGQVGTLSQAAVTRAFPRILGDLDRMGAGYAALELVRELTREDEPVPEVFATTVAMLDALDAQGAQPRPLLVCFMARMMGLSGFAPRLDACGHCGKRPGAEQAALFDPRMGHLVCRACGGASHSLSGRVRALLIHAASDDFRVAAAEPWSPRELGSARDAIRSFVEHRIGKRLSAELLTPAASDARDSGKGTT